MNIFIIIVLTVSLIELVLFILHTLLGRKNGR